MTFDGFLLSVHTSGIISSLSFVYIALHPVVPFSAQFPQYIRHVTSKILLHKYLAPSTPKFQNSMLIPLRFSSKPSTLHKRDFGGHGIAIIVIIVAIFSVSLILVKYCARVVNAKKPKRSSDNSSNDGQILEENHQVYTEDNLPHTPPPEYVSDMPIPPPAYVR